MTSERSAGQNAGAGEINKNAAGAFKPGRDRLGDLRPMTVSATAAAAADRTVTYNARTFLINGEPEIFLSAAIHYFRVPRELWADRIAKARRGGMNTIETYVAWNFHEEQQGRFDFDGDRDLDAFFAECARQNMYVIARPGPYICAEWDYGGFPAWLQTLPGVAFRTMNRPYLDAVARWFDALVPIIERHQWTRGGNVILVQVENEYANLQWTRGKDMVVDDEYQQWVRDALLARGINVPLITCAGHCSGTIECVNSHDPADQMPEFRTKYPDKPIFSTEFWTAWYDAWGQPHHTRSAEDVEYASLRCFAEGACGYNYYVFHGGTNFGYTPMYLQTTSYDYDAQISETGRLTDKWRASRRVALFAQTFKEILLTGEHRRGLPTFGDERLRVSETRTPQRGGILWLDNPDKEATITGAVPPYVSEVTLGPRQLLPWVHDVPIGPASKYLSAYAGLVKSDARVLAAHVLPDPFEGARVYVYGEPGTSAEVVLFFGGERGQAVTVQFDAQAPQLYTAGPSQIVALPTELAGRTWIHPDDENAPVVFGPDDVREHNTDDLVGEFAAGRTHTVYSLLPNGELAETTFDAPALPPPPTLSAWQTLAEPDFAAPDFDDGDWLELGEPTNMIALGNGSSPYGWYRATVEADAATNATLHFSACSDRLTLFVNGARVGASPVPPEDRRGDWTADFDITLQPGPNTLCVLADGLGLIKGDWQIGAGQEHEKKGIYGPVTLTLGDGGQMNVNQWRFQGMLHGEREGWWQPGADWSRLPPADSGPVRWHRTTFTLDAPLDSATPLLVRLAGMGKGVLWLNGRNLGRYWVEAGPQTNYYAPEPWLNVGENILVLVETEGNTPENVSLVWDEKAAAIVRVAL